MSEVVSDTSLFPLAPAVGRRGPPHPPRTAPRPVIEQVVQDTIMPWPVFIIILITPSSKWRTFIGLCFPLWGTLFLMSLFS